MSKKKPMSAKSSTSSGAGKKFEKEQAEAVAAGKELAAELELTKAALADTQKAKESLAETVAQDTAVIAALDKELEEEKKIGAEQAELIDRLKAEAKESRERSGEFEKLLAAEREKYAELESKKAVAGAGPDVLVLLQGIIKHNPNCDTSEGGVMHKQCTRGVPCLFRRARQLLRGHGMEI
ncbi:MAG: hypothetical protein ACYTBJ_01845 [Planctomycetota bacterium]|jgi:hypothetical protein